MVNPNQSFYLIELGGHIGTDAPFILWENGAGTFQTESYNINNIIEAAAANKTPFLNISLTTSLTETFYGNQNRTSVFCQSPLISSFCIDSSALMLEMSKVGETFLTDKIETTMMSSFTCINFCKSQSANVRQQRHFFSTDHLKTILIKKCNHHYSK
jgi:hypothetical protein